MDDSLNSPMDEKEIGDLIYQLALKKESRLNDLEAEQLVYLYALYGVGATSLAIQMLQQVDISNLGKLLMQIGGFCNIVPPELKGVVFTKDEAKKHYGDEQIRVAEQFEKLAVLLSDIDQIEPYIRERYDMSLHQTWVEQVGAPVTPDERNAINSAIKQYGLPLAIRAIHVAAKRDISKENRIKILQNWLEAASTRDLPLLETIMRQAGHVNSSITWNLPLACPFIVSAYYEVKTNKELTESDMSLLKTMVDTSSEGEVIFSISSIPATQFSADKLATEHYTKTGKFSELVYYLIEKEKVKDSYFCTDCKLQLFKTFSDYFSSSDRDTCPECLSGKLETHSLDENLPNIDKDLMRKFEEEDPMLYSFLITSVPSEYCPNCGGHFFIGDNTYSELSNSPLEDIDRFQNE